MKIQGKTAIRVTLIRSEALLIQQALFHYCHLLQDSDTSMAQDVARMGYAIQDHLNRKPVRKSRKVQEVSK